VRLALLFVSVRLVAFGQDSSRDVRPVPAERRTDVYAVYSAVLLRPSLSHPDDNRKYLIADVSGTPGESDPALCITVPETHRAAFAELLADRNEHSLKRFRLDLAFNILKPYDLLTDEEANQFSELRNSPGRRTNEVGKFRGAIDLITLGNVYFDKNRTIAAVYTSAYCGSLCALGTWHVFIKTSKGDWDKQNWVKCMTIAAAYPPRAGFGAFAEPQFVPESN
jgi:hypothetical protein